VGHQPGGVVHANRLLTVALALGAAALSGCGGGSSGGKTAFLKAGDALCKSINDTIARVARPATSRTQHARQDRAILSAAITARQRFARLTPPAGERRLVTLFLQAFDAKIAAVRALTVSTEHADRAGFARAQAANHRADVRFNSLAHRIGFNVCGYPSTRPPPPT
jgi:hypothetical protein